MKKMLTIVFVIMTCFLNADSGEAKNALLIANGRYNHFADIGNPVREARGLSSALRSIGFEVVLVENADRELMLDAIYDFEQQIERDGGVAFFHFGGHGLQVNGENYLVPSSADIPDERRVATRAVNVREITSAMDSSGSSVNIVVLDACRNNPLPATSERSASRGLSVISTQPKNSVIIYSAQADKIAVDGVFTPALTRYITEKGVSLTEVLQKVRRNVYETTGGRQTPGEYSELFAPVYLAGTAGEITTGDAGVISDREPVQSSPIYSGLTRDLTLLYVDRYSIWVNGQKIGPSSPLLVSSDASKRSVTLRLPASETVELRVQDSRGLTLNGIVDLSENASVNIERERISIAQGRPNVLKVEE
jgi:Caspase domain